MYFEEITPKLRGQYTEKYTENLSEAIEKIRTNTTLHNKMRNPVNCPKGATTILSKLQEDELAEWILMHGDFGDPRTKQDIIVAAAEIAQLDENSTNNFKNGTPTSGWYDGFLKRHPLCRERTPQGMSKGSAINTRDDFAITFTIISKKPTNSICSTNLNCGGMPMKLVSRKTRFPKRSLHDEEQNALVVEKWDRRSLTQL